MTLELYHHGNSVCAQKVRLTLEEKRLPWREHFVDILHGAQFRPDYLKLNPRAVVPTLIHDGRVVRESAVICEYLDEAFPELALRSADPYGRAQMRLWTKIPDESLHAACAAVTFTTFFRYLLLGLPPNQVLAMPLDEVTRLAHDRLEPRVLERKHDWIVKGLEAPDAQAAFRTYDRVLEEMEAALSVGPWLLGSQYTLADIALIPYVDRLANLSLGAMWARRPRVAAWYEQVRARPNFASAIARWIDPAELDSMRSIGALSWPRIEMLLRAG